MPGAYAERLVFLDFSLSENSCILSFSHQNGLGCLSYCRPDLVLFKLDRPVGCDAINTVFCDELYCPLNDAVEYSFVGVKKFFPAIFNPVFIHVRRDFFKQIEVPFLFRHPWTFLRPIRNVQQADHHPISFLLLLELRSFPVILPRTRHIFDLRLLILGVLRFRYAPILINRARSCKTSCRKCHRFKRLLSAPFMVGAALRVSSDLFFGDNHLSFSFAKKRKDRKVAATRKLSGTRQRQVVSQIPRGLPSIRLVPAEVLFDHRSKHIGQDQGSGLVVQLS